MLFSRRISSLFRPPAGAVKPYRRISRELLTPHPVIVSSTKLPGLGLSAVEIADLTTSPGGLWHHPYYRIGYLDLPEFPIVNVMAAWQKN